MRKLLLDKVREDYSQQQTTPQFNLVSYNANTYPQEALNNSHQPSSLGLPSMQQMLPPPPPSSFFMGPPSRMNEKVIGTNFLPAHTMKSLNTNIKKESGVSGAAGASQSVKSNRIESDEDFEFDDEDHASDEDYVQEDEKKRKSPPSKKSQSHPVKRKKPNSTQKTSTTDEHACEQTNCCVVGCEKEVSNRLRFSLRCSGVALRQDFLDRDWDKICNYCYFHDLYQWKKLQQQKTKDESTTLCEKVVSTPCENLKKKKRNTAVKKPLKIDTSITTSALQGQVGVNSQLLTEPSPVHKEDVNALLDFLHNASCQ